MTWADILILSATTGYFGAAGLYFMDADYARFGIFGMYGLCNILIAVGTK